MQLFDPQASGGLIPVLNIDESEVQRQMTICNACRYCEGFCAVFPAMTPVSYTHLTLPTNREV